MSLPPDFYKIDQIGIVVRDLQRSMEQYHELLGWGPWDVFEYEAPWLHTTEIRGEAREYTMLGAETMVGDLVVELIEPTSPEPVHGVARDARRGPPPPARRLGRRHPVERGADRRRRPRGAVDARPGGVHEARLRGADVGPHRRRVAVLLPRHAAGAQGDHRVGRRRCARSAGRAEVSGLELTARSARTAPPRRRRSARPPRSRPCRSGRGRTAWCPRARGCHRGPKSSRACPRGSRP